MDDDLLYLLGGFCHCGFWFLDVCLLLVYGVDINVRRETAFCHHEIPLWCWRSFRVGRNGPGLELQIVLCVDCRRTSIGLDLHRWLKDRLCSTGAKARVQHD